jgi:DNA-binding MarR family transcriptional regulator
MLIKPRPLKMKNKDRGAEKTLLVCLWLLEWRVSTIEICAARIGLTPTSCTRFFKKLLAKQIIERIDIIDCDKRDLIILGTKGHKMLGTSDIAYAAEINRVRKYTKKQTIKHDIWAQKVALKLLPCAMEIISDFNIKLEAKKPDVLVYRWNAARDEADIVAVEMEATAKDRDGIFFMLHTYLKLIEEKKVHEVRFYFLTKDDMTKYLRYFNRDMWPTTGKKQIKGATVPTTVMKTVAEDDWRRKQFSFELLDTEEPPVIFPIFEAAKLERWFLIPYVDRMKGRGVEPLIEKAREEQKKREQDVREEERRALDEEEEERNEVLARLEERKQKLSWFGSELDKALAEDRSFKANLPGYKWKWDPLNQEYTKYILEQLALEERETRLAYELE